MDRWDNKLLNSSAQTLSPGMLKKLTLMLAGTKPLQTGSHVYVPQPRLPAGLVRGPSAPLRSAAMLYRGQDTCVCPS